MMYPGTKRSSMLNAQPASAVDLGGQRVHQQVVHDNQTVYAVIRVMCLGACLQNGTRRLSNSLKRYRHYNNTDRPAEACGARNTTLFGM